MLQVVALLALLAADPDKSLAPDGKPWTAASLCEYLAKELKPLGEFELTHQLEMEAGSGKAKKTYVVSETPARKRLIEKISRKHQLDEPKQRILVFPQREQLSAVIYREARDSARMRAHPAENVNDDRVQSIYWTSAVEVIEWGGNAQAAEEYDAGFAAEPAHGRLDHFQWYGVTLTGSEGPMFHIKKAREDYPGYSPTGAPVASN